MKADTETLRKAIELPLSLARENANLPILSCFHIQSDEKICLVRASDADQFAESSLACKGLLAACCVSARALSTNLSLSGKETELVTEGASVVMNGGDFTIKTLPAEEFIAWPADNFSKLVIPASVLGDAIERVQFASTRDKETFARYGVHIVASKEKLLVEATNGNVLAQEWIKTVVSGSSSFDAFIPLNFLPALVSALGQKDATMYLSDRFAAVKFKSGKFACRRSKASFPNTSAFLNSDSKPVGTIIPSKWKTLFSAVKEMSGGDFLNIPKVSISEGRFKHEGKHGGINLSAPEKVKAELKLNADNFSNCLAAFPPNEKVSLSVQDGSGALVMKSESFTVITSQIRD